MLICLTYTHNCAAGFGKQFGGKQYYTIPYKIMNNHIHVSLIMSCVVFAQPVKMRPRVGAFQEQFELARPCRCWLERAIWNRRCRERCLYCIPPEIQVQTNTPGARRLANRVWADRVVDWCVSIWMRLLFNTYRCLLKNALRHKERYMAIRVSMCVLLVGTHITAYHYLCRRAFFSQTTVWPGLLCLFRSTDVGKQTHRCWALCKAPSTHRPVSASVVR